MKKDLTDEQNKQRTSFPSDNSTQKERGGDPTLAKAAKRWKGKTCFLRPNQETA